MSNWIQTAHIQNFKSLRDVSLECERINIFVGRPNVGKSNLLEALALLGPYFLNNEQSGFARPLIRYEKIANLFYDQTYFDNPIEIIAANLGSVYLAYKNNSFIYEFSEGSIVSFEIQIHPDGVLGTRSFTPNKSHELIKKYQFSSVQRFQRNEKILYLEPPLGTNLLDVLQINKIIRQEIGNIFESYELEVLLDADENKLEIVKRHDGILFKTPFSLVADTLRRYMFHLAAIESNRDSILLFEEPEAHNFPPYITRLTNRILESKTNQFFLTTHSPFIFNMLVEEASDVAVFFVDYVNHQTIVRRLTEENLREILDYGLNIFTQQELFTDNASV